MKNQVTEYKICLSFLCGVFLSVIITKFITGFIKADERYLALAKKYPLDMEQVLPEPQEMTGFVLFWITYALCFLFLFYLFEKRDIRVHSGVVFVAGAVLALVGSYVLLFAEEDQFYISMSWFMDWRMLFCVTVICASIYGISVVKDISKAADIVSLILVCVSSLFCFVRNPLFGTNAWHFNGYFATVYNVYNGAVLGIDSNIIYGTYAYLFYPIYKLIGLSLTSYAFVTMVMCLIIMLCERYIIRVLIDNAVLRLLAISGCIYINVFFAVHVHYEQFITQHFPMRIFFPMVMLAFVVFLSKRNKLTNNKYYALGIVLCYLSFMMNLESAVTTSMVWISACFYNKMMENKMKSKMHDLWKCVVFALKHVAGMIIAMLCWVLCIELITYWKAGQFIEISHLYSTQLVFSKIGYGMLPLPDYIHVYMFVFLIYALFLGIALKQIFWGGR